MKELWTTLRDLLNVLPAGARRFLAGYGALTSALTLLDVAAMGLIALIISPSINGGPVTLPLIGELPEDRIPVLVVIACGLIMLKSGLSILLHWVATQRFARYELAVGERLFNAYTHSTWEQRSRRSVAEITRIADQGIAGAVSGFILQLSSLPRSASTFVLVLGVLVIADPLTSVIAFVYLSIVAFSVNRIVTRRALRASRTTRDYSYRVATLMTEMVEALKELSLRNRLDQISEVVTSYRRVSTLSRAKTSFLGVVPLASFESALVGGFLLVGGVNLALGGMSQAIASVVLFAATGFRLIPAVNAMQQSLVNASAAMPVAQDVLGDLTEAEARPRAADSLSASHRPVPTDGVIELDHVSFRYPGASTDALRNVSLTIRPGTSLAIVGPSGAGKSTLVDIILGLSEPTEGTITVGGLPFVDVMRDWRSRVGYVPQRVALFDGSIAQNVALTWEDDFDEEAVIAALERAQLGSLLAGRDGGVRARIGERGVALSGGQQQRLGVARALYTDPSVLVLDEATSALDTRTEDEVSQAIRKLHGDVTIVTVAHRLSTIRDHEQVCYLEDAEVRGLGTFSDLARSVPAFRDQVRLAGLLGDEVL